MDKKLIKRLKRIHNKDDKFSIMDLLELYNMNTYLKNSSHFYYGNDKKHNIISHNNKIINMNLPSVSELIKKAYDEINLTKVIDYHHILWNFLTKFKYLKKHSNEIKNLIIVYSNNNELLFPISNKKIVNTFPKLFTDLLLQNPKNLEILLQNNNVQRPKGFNEKSINKLCKSYLNIKDYNLNILEDIIYCKEIAPSLKLQAQDIYDKDIDNHFKNDIIYENNSLVQFNMTNSSNKLTDFKVEQNNLNILSKFSVNGKFILKHLNNYDIMDNFIFTLHILDYNFLIQSFINKYHKSIFANTTNKNFYDYQYNSSYIDQINLAKFKGYYKFLRENNINLMEILKWFYTSYLFKEYNINRFNNLNIEYDSKKYSDKCENLVIQLHSVIKIYNLYSNDSNFDKRLIDYSSKVPQSFSDLNSINKRTKYIYIKPNSKLNKYIELLFSERIHFKKNDNSKFNFLGMKYSDISFIYKSDVDDMIKDKILKINIDDKITIKHNGKFNLLYYYYNHGVIPYYWIDTNFRKLIHYLIENTDDFEINNTLLTKEESNYFDYFLNNKYINGVGLRNKYAHGSTNSFSKEKHKNNYIRILFLFLLLSIKINEELDYDKNHKNYKAYSSTINNLNFK